jgi:protoporphyrinogen oxidase
VLRSALGIRTEGYAHQAVFHYPLEGGFESLVRGLLARIPEGVVRTSTVVRSVERTPTGFRVDGKDYDRLVSTIPLQELAATIDDMPDSVRAAFDSLDHTSLMTVFLALDKDDAPPHSWIYFPDAADGPQNRITWLSNYSPRNAPPGKSSLMAEVTYHGHPPGTDEEVTANVVSGLERAGFIRKEQILFTRVWHNPYAYILYLHGLETELERVRQWCASIGLDVAGRFGNYSYFNSDMCVRAVMDLVKSRYAHP